MFRAACTRARTDEPRRRRRLTSSLPTLLVAPVTRIMLLLLSLDGQSAPAACATAWLDVNTSVATGQGTPARLERCAAARNARDVDPAFTRSFMTMSCLLHARRRCVSIRVPTN